jgi:hypothetical protein
MIDVDVGDKRTTSSMSRATKTLLTILRQSLSSGDKLIMLITIIVLMIMLMLMPMIMIMIMLMLMLMIMLLMTIIIILMLIVLLQTLVSPVSPWTLRAPGQVVRYLRLSVGMVLSRGENI